MVGRRLKRAVSGRCGSAAAGTNFLVPTVERSATILDVRPADKFAAGYISRVLNTTLPQIERISPTFDLVVEIVVY